jgi:hypothetical protein
MASSPDTTLNQQLLGTGLACAPVQPGLDVGRDLQLFTGSGGVDLARVDGLDNLVQGLEVALTTALSSDVFNVDFGFDGINALTDPDPALLARERVRIAVIKTLTADPRVSSILDLKVLDGRLDPVSQSSVQPGSLDGWRTLSVTVAFETISGDQAAINIGRLISGG